MPNEINREQHRGIQVVQTQDRAASANRRAGGTQPRFSLEFTETQEEKKIKKKASLFFLQAHEWL